MDKVSDSINKTAFQVINKSPAAAFLFNDHGKLIRVNEQACQIFRYSAQELSEIYLYDLVASQDLEKLDNALTVLKDKGEVSTELSFIAKNRKSTVLRFDSSAVSSGLFVAYCSSLLDADAAELFSLAQEAAGVAAWEWNIKTGELKLSRMFENLFGFRLGEIKADFDDFIKRIHQDDRARVQETIELALKGEIDYRVEHRIIHQDGTVRWLLGTGDVFRDENGNPERMVGIAQDVTERKHADEVIRERIKSLTSPPEAIRDVTFKELFDVGEIQKIQDAFSKATGVASIITTPEGVPITRPSNFCRLCNDIIRKTEKGRRNCFHSDAVIGRHNPDGPIVQPCLSGGLWDGGASISVGNLHLANWLVGQVRNEEINEEKLMDYAREIGADEGEFREALRDVTVMSGKQFKHICEALFIFANQMSRTAYQNLLQARFITEKKLMERKLIDKNRELDNFADWVAHDLKSPLMALKGYLNLMKEDPEIFNEFFHRASAKTDQMVSFIESLLELARAGKIEEEDKSIIDLKELLVSLRSQVDHYGFDVEVRIPKPLPDIYGNFIGIGQLFRNLLENSIKHRNNEEEKVIIRVTGENLNSNKVRIILEDNGKGISKNNLEKVFKAGFSLKKERNGGFGLAICKKIVEGHGGSIRLESDGLKKGTRVVFELPQKNVSIP